MKKVTKVALALASSLLVYSAAYSTSVPNTDHPVTFLGPTARVGYTSTLNNVTAYSVAGELGIKDTRLGATLGWKIHDNQYLKVTGEYLWQKITYAFFAGNTDQWVNQGAIGAAYQYNFLNDRLKPEFDFTGYLAHGPSKTLNTINGKFINNQSILVSFSDMRRIAGSNAGGLSPGIAIQPWRGGKVGAAVNYDNVRYDTINRQNENAKGWGGTVTFDQLIIREVGVGVSAAVRQPFNNYAASLNWSYTPSPYFGKWMLSLFGEYNVGKKTLPNSYNAGISGNYFIDQRCECLPVNLKGKITTRLRPVSDSLLAWAAKPAVYMPQVLAINDET